MLPRLLRSLIYRESLVSRPVMGRLTEQKIFTKQKVNDAQLAAITQLNFWGSGLTDVSIVRQISNVEVLSLGFNMIATLKPFQHLRKLRSLYLCKNRVTNLSELTYIKDLPELRCLDLTGNPCCEKAGENYRLKVISVLPQLTKLDGKDVTEEEREEAYQLLEEESIYKYCSSFGAANEIEEEELAAEENTEDITGDLPPQAMDDGTESRNCHQQEVESSTPLQYPGGQGGTLKDQSQTSCGVYASRQRQRKDLRLPDDEKQMIVEAVKLHLRDTERALPQQECNAGYQKILRQSQHECSSVSDTPTSSVSCQAQCKALQPPHHLQSHQSDTQTITVPVSREGSAGDGPTQSNGETEAYKIESGDRAEEARRRSHAELAVQQRCGLSLPVDDADHIHEDPRSISRKKAQELIEKMQFDRRYVGPVIRPRAGRTTQQTNSPQPTKHSAKHEECVQVEKESSELYKTHSGSSSLCPVGCESQHGNEYEQGEEKIKRHSGSSNRCQQQHDVEYEEGYEKIHPESEQHKPHTRPLYTEGQLPDVEPQSRHSSRYSTKSEISSRYSRLQQQSSARAYLTERDPQKNQHQQNSSEHYDESHLSESVEHIYVHTEEYYDELEMPEAVKDIYQPKRSECKVRQTSSSLLLAAIGIANELDFNSLRTLSEIVHSRLEQMMNDE